MTLGQPNEEVKVKRQSISSAETEITAKKSIKTLVKETIHVETVSSGPSVRENRIDVDLLDEINIKVYNRMIPDVPMIPDELVTNTLSVSDVLSSLSLLELGVRVVLLINQICQCQKNY